MSRSVKVSTTVSVPIDPRAGSFLLIFHEDPYFPGGAIGMARVLYDGLVEYPDVRFR